MASKARRAELEVLPKRCEEKAERARRVPCIHDTALVRGWLSDISPSCEEVPASRAIH